MEDYFITLYNDKSEKREYPINNYFDTGACGFIYRIDNDKCLKLLSDDLYFDPSIIKVMKKLKLENFYKIYDILFDEKNNYFGYTMKYYQKEDINILNMPIDYTLDNLYKLFNSFKKLNKNNIYAYDCSAGNVIMDSKNITVIDADLYFFYNKNENKELVEDNYNILMNLFKYLCYKELKELGYLLEDTNYVLSDLFDENKEISHVEKKLIKYKYPIDYFNDFYKGKC